MAPTRHKCQKAIMALMAPTPQSWFQCQYHNHPLKGVNDTFDTWSHKSQMILLIPSDTAPHTPPRGALKNAPRPFTVRHYENSPTDREWFWPADPRGHFCPGRLRRHPAYPDADFVGVLTERFVAFQKWEATPFGAQERHSVRGNKAVRVTGQQGPENMAANWQQSRSPE